ncbi:hypothetical protein B0H14DRAFT_3547904 [Mycena olivaceomarginata]|nr:hypothetical protein B0H14DRAFT_3547904 [Mycena olivaceomarginata]
MSRGSESPPPSSLSLHRSRHSSPRHTPYNSEHRLHCKGNENFNPAVKTVTPLYRRRDWSNLQQHGDGQPGDFHSQYLPYGGSSGAYDRALLSSLHTQDLSRLPSLTTLVNVDELSSQYGLNNGQRKAVHAFCKMSSEDRAVTIFLRLLRTERQNGEIQVQMQQVQSGDQPTAPHSDSDSSASVDELRHCPASVAHFNATCAISHLDNIAVFCVQNWKPSPEQVKLLKSLLHHYIIRPVTSYNNLVPLVETYILNHAAQLRLGLYKDVLEQSHITFLLISRVTVHQADFQQDDPTVKTVVNALLVKENRNTRSAIRKLVWTSLTERSSLDTFTKKIVQAYHLPTIPVSSPQDIMACMALMRKIAKPLLKKDSQRSGDTGFWRDIEAELDVLFDKNGNQRDSAAWRNARTQEEINAAVLPGANDAAADEDEEENAGSTREDREVHISDLGDLEVLAVSAVVHSST